MEHVRIVPIYNPYRRWYNYRPYPYYYAPYGNYRYGGIYQNIYNNGWMYDVNQYAEINQFSEEKSSEETDINNPTINTPSSVTEVVVEQTPTEVHVLMPEQGA